MDLRAVVDRLRGCRVLVIGDAMIDEYIKGDVSRISPEAPVPVLEWRSEEYRLGGAANAAANIQALGGASALVGVVGADKPAERLRSQLVASRIEDALVADANRPTSMKTRLVAQQQQIVRVDREKRVPVTGMVADEVRRAID